MNKYVRVMDGLRSNAGGFEYKLDEINVNGKLQHLIQKKWEVLILV